MPVHISLEYNIILPKLDAVPLFITFYLIKIIHENVDHTETHYIWKKDCKKVL